MYKLTDSYWPKLARVSVIIVVLGVIILCAMGLIFDLEQHFLSTDIDAYVALNGAEPSREIQDKFMRSAKLKTLPLSLALIVLINFLSIKYLFKPSAK